MTDEVIEELRRVRVKDYHFAWDDPKENLFPQFSKDVATMMGLLKVARIATGNKADSFVDLAGYAACAGEIATAEGA